MSHFFCVFFWPPFYYLTQLHTNTTCFSSRHPPGFSYFSPTMTDSVAVASLTPVRTLSKSSDRSPLSSDNLAPSLPSNPPVTSSPGLHDASSGNSSPPPMGLRSASGPLALGPHDTQDHLTSLEDRTASQGVNGPGSPETGPVAYTGQRAPPSTEQSGSGSGSESVAAPPQQTVSQASQQNGAVSEAAASSSGAASGASSGFTGPSNAPAPAASRNHPSRPQQSGLARRPSFGLSFLSSLSNTIRGSHSNLSTPDVSTGPLHSHNHTDSHPPSHTHPHQPPQSHFFMSNSPTIANISGVADPSTDMNATAGSSNSLAENQGQPLLARQDTMVRSQPIISEETTETEAIKEEDSTGKDKDGFYSVRLTPIIDHLTSNTGLYFSPTIRRIKPQELISIGRYTEKNKSAAHAPQGSSAPIVFKSKVVSRTHAMFQCNEDGSWFLKDCKSSSGTFLNNVRLSQASQELTLWPLIDGDIVQLGLDYRGGTEEVYRCVKMRCEFNRSWQRKVNQFNLDIHKKMKRLGIEPDKDGDGSELSECAICLLKLEPCQALFISPCSHSWHYKCIRPIIIKSYPQFYCPNCRSMCDLETDIEDE